MESYNYFIRFIYFLKKKIKIYDRMYFVHCYVCSTSTAYLRERLIILLRGILRSKPSLKYKITLNRQMMAVVTALDPITFLDVNSMSFRI